MIRKHAASTLLAAVALQASLAHGLGLGDITLRSASSCTSNWMSESR